ncbi:putative membrane protein [Streptomyces sp. TE3672]
MHLTVHRTVLRGLQRQHCSRRPRACSRGLADFGGGLLTRRAPALTVVVVSQAVAAVVLGAVVVATGGWSEAGPRLWFAVAAGVVGPVAMLSFYQAPALDPMGVVSPLGSLGVVVPVSIGLLAGERPGLPQFAAY